MNLSIKYGLANPVGIKPLVVIEPGNIQFDCVLYHHFTALFRGASNRARALRQCGRVAKRSLQSVTNDSPWESGGHTQASAHAIPTHWRRHQNGYRDPQYLSNVN